MNTKTDNVLRIYYHKLNKHLKCLISTVSPTLNSKIMFLRIFGRRLNLKNPKDFNEKLMWLKLNTYKNNNLVTLCADKYKVREYISERGYSEILNEMIDSWDSVDDIKWEGLPNKFALKCNHGAGYNIICTDKEKLDINATIEVLKKWMKEDFWKKNAEINYKNIPKKIICEKFISSQNSYYPVDYKIYCFNGEPIFIGVFIERNKETFKVRRGYFNFNWELQNFLIDNNQNNPNDFPKPKYLNEMYKIAKDLSKPFPFVRIDFYESEDRIIFGEFTFTPSACLADYYNKETLEKLGDLLVLPSRE